MRRIMDAIKQGGGEARVVGGAVRDALMGRVVGEIDFACNLPPEKISAILTKAGIKAEPTGIEHGTITAVVDHKGYEITALRHDVETYGRRAKVKFTDDWQADAARRDFTINALYADAEGTIFDYFNGREDLAAGRVRFIGEAEERIKEDILRILRFFRFYAWFARGAADAAGLRACHDLAALLPELSAERIWREIGKLLMAQNPAPAWQLIIEQKILPHFLPEADDIARLEKLLAVERKYEIAPKALLRLAALLPRDEKIAGHVAQQLKLSKREGEDLRALAGLPELLRGKLDPIPFRRMLYHYGAEACRTAALLIAAETGVDLDLALAEASDWQKPAFPLKGEDLLKLGLSPGPSLGKTLQALEAWWIAQDFKPGREQCLAEARQRLKS